MEWWLCPKAIKPDLTHQWYFIDEPNFEGKRIFACCACKAWYKKRWWGDRPQPYQPTPEEEERFQLLIRQRQGEQVTQ